MVREVHRLHTCAGSDVDAHRDEEGCVESLLVVSDDGPAELSRNFTFRASRTFNHVLDSTVLVRMMTCLLCVHIVHFTLKQVTSQRKRQICKDA